MLCAWHELLFTCCSTKPQTSCKYISFIFINICRFFVQGCVEEKNKSGFQNQVDFGVRKTHPSDLACIILRKLLLFDSNLASIYVNRVPNEVANCTWLRHGRVPPIPDCQSALQFGLICFWLGILLAFILVSAAFCVKKS